MFPLAQDIRLRHWFSCPSFPLVGSLLSKVEEAPPAPSFSVTFLDQRPAMTNEPDLSVFWVKVFFLLDGLPSLAYKILLPGFFIGVFLLLGEIPDQAAGLHQPDQLTHGGGLC